MYVCLSNLSVVFIQPGTELREPSRYNCHIYFSIIYLRENRRVGFAGATSDDTLQSLL